jgi:ketosteroid isomerase-like protein
MKKGLIGTCLLLLTGACFAQTTPSQKDQAAIRQVMADQAAAWNKGSVEEFMKGYWNSDSLIFIGKSGISYGYRQALHNYRKNYSNRDQMGTLFFTLLKIKRLSPEYSFVIGKWMLKRKVGDIGGIYTLLFRKIDGQWMIVVDHTS